MSDPESPTVSPDQLRTTADKIRAELAKLIVGQEDVIDLLLIALFCRGHCLLEGPPGLAKTLLVSTLARSLNLSFSRIQFTPDLMPADITGDRDDRTKSAPRAAGNSVFLEGAGLFQHDPRRRDQPDASEDAGGAA